MATHKFKVGETVELRPSRFDPNVPRGLYGIGVPDMTRMSGTERSLKWWEAWDASPPQKKARAAHAEKHDAR